VVLIEPDPQRVDLALELAEPPRQPVALLAERLGQRHHRFDEPVLAVVGGLGGAHWRPPAKVRGPGSNSGAALGLGKNAHLTRRRVAGLTA
jgi:hypothetical protein